MQYGLRKLLYTLTLAITVCCPLAAISFLMTRTEFTLNVKWGCPKVEPETCLMQRACSAIVWTRLLCWCLELGNSTQLALTFQVQDFTPDAYLSFTVCVS